MYQLYKCYLSIIRCNKKQCFAPLEVQLQYENMKGKFLSYCFFLYIGGGDKAQYITILIIIMRIIINIMFFAYKENNKLGNKVIIYLMLLHLTLHYKAR